MSYVEAVYRHGVFQPLEPVDLPDEQRVRLSIEPTGSRGLESWLSEVKAIQATILQRRGPLPDSTLEIAADRLR